MNRRTVIRNMTLSAGASLLGPGLRSFAAGITEPFAPTWDSLAKYTVPQWFREAKFGMWAHWGPQCQPEAGDWYARLMYIEGSPQ
ncbi:MAG TPA: alpha-L-fucosidase, partial [Puia sp.]|nr:alpha-L-fucosidase [Puia sp.]